LEYILFAGYLILFSWLVTKVKFFTRSCLTKAQLIIIFLLKVMAGILYGWVGIYYGNMAQMVDTWGFHYYSLAQYKLLQTNPTEYLTDIFYNPYADGFYTFFSSDHSFWLNLQGNAMIKILSVFDIFSFGNYYINTIFYVFMTFFGSVALFRVMEHVFPGKKPALILSVFFIPSFLFWASGIHKEGIIFTGICLVVYCVYFSIVQKKLTIKRACGIAGGLLLIFIFRSFLLFTIIPALVAWMIATRFPARVSRVFFIVYLIFGVLFFTTRYISPRLDFPNAVIAKQQDFLRLQGGNSAITLKKMKPEAISFITVMPHALITSAIRPFPADAKNILSLAAAVEINMLLLCTILFLVYPAKDGRNRAFLYFCIFFSITTFLVIGYTVSFIGAIVRYRSIILPFLVVPMIALTDWRRASKSVFNNSKN
jgi:hypothetical protein